MAKKHQSRKILGKATALFWKKGYNSTTMQDIADACGCKAANIYNFFPNKEAILFEVLSEVMEKIIGPVRHLEEEDGTSPVEQLRLFIESHSKVTLGYRRSVKMIFDVSLDYLSKSNRKKIIAFRDTYDRIIRKIIRRGIDSGKFRQIDEKLVGFMIASMISRSKIWFQSNKGLSASQLPNFIFHFVLYALGAHEKGRAESNKF